MNSLIKLSLTALLVGLLYFWSSFQDPIAHPKAPIASLSQPKVCLNMIVKDEKDVIARCLASTLPLIDTWVIVDTGSTDGTQKIIQDFMAKKGIPGKLYERPWKNFEHNRNEALELAKNEADHLLFIDADEYFVFTPDYKRPSLEKDFYYIPLHYGGLKYGRISLIRTDLEWKWAGVLHEALVIPPSATSETLEDVYNHITQEGARSKDPEKFAKDANVLKEALKKDPHNTRYQFYLAQSYKDGGNHELALEHYEKRVAMGGWDQELFYSHLQVAALKEKLGMPSANVVESYVKAIQTRKSRAEAYYYLAEHQRKQSNHKAAYQLAQIAATMPESDDVLFVQKWIHDYGAELELSINAYWVGKYDECQQISLKLLKQNDLPPNVRECIQRNLGFANEKLMEMALKQ